MKKRIWWLVLAAALVLAISVGTTVAYLVASSGTVRNTFTVGSVSIALTETTGEAYKLTPGLAVAKDPTVTVLAGSEGCWLFVKVEKSGPFDTFCSYAMADGWSALPGHSGLYYRQVERATQSMAFPVLKNNAVQVSAAVTEEMLGALQQPPTLKFTAYAVQSDGLDTAHEAWQALSP